MVFPFVKKKQHYGEGSLCQMCTEVMFLALSHRDTLLTFSVDTAEVVGSTASVSLLLVFEGMSVLLAPAQELFAHILSDFHRILKP